MRYPSFYQEEEQEFMEHIRDLVENMYIEGKNVEIEVSEIIDHILAASNDHLLRARLLMFSYEIFQVGKDLYADAQKEDKKHALRKE